MAAAAAGRDAGGRHCPRNAAADEGRAAAGGAQASGANTLGALGRSLALCPPYLPACRQSSLRWLPPRRVHHKPLSIRPPSTILNSFLMRFPPPPSHAPHAPPPPKPPPTAPPEFRRTASPSAPPRCAWAPVGWRSPSTRRRRRAGTRVRCGAVAVRWGGREGGGWWSHRGWWGAQLCESSSSIG